MAAINNRFPASPDGEIIPSAGTWQAEAYAGGRKFFGSDVHATQDTPLEKAIMPPEPTELGKAQAIGTIAILEVPDNIVRGYN